MCEPATIIAVTTAVTAGFSAVQQRQQGRFQERTAEYNARVSENQAEETRNAGVEQENSHRERVARLQATQRAQLGASGVDANSGSALQLQQDTALSGEVDAIRIRNNALNQADSLDSGAALTRLEGANARQAGNAEAVGTILGGASGVLGTGVADKWFAPDSAARVGTS